MKQVWWVLLCLLLSSCAQLPSGPQTVYFQGPPSLGEGGGGNAAPGGVVSFPLDPEWTAVYAPEGRSWRHKQRGTLRVFAVAARPEELTVLRELSQQVPGPDAERLMSVSRALQLQPLYQGERGTKLFEIVGLARKGRAAQAHTRLVSLVEAWDKEWQTEDFAALLLLRFKTRALLRYAKSDLSVLRVQERAPAVVCPVSQGQTIDDGLYVLHGDSILVFELSNSNTHDFLRQLADTLQLDATVPDAKLLEGPPPPQAASPTPAPQPERRLGAPDLSRPALRALALLLVCLFGGLPAYLGAVAGYETARVGGEDVRAGAARGASSASFYTTQAVTVLVCLTVVALGAIYNRDGAGIMSLLAGSVFIALLVGCAGLVMGVVAALMAAAGASLGARWGPSSAGRLAALGVVLALVVAPLLVILR